MENLKYLSKDLIDIIEKKAKALSLRSGGIFLARKWDDIIFISKNHLIHFLGNSFTGWTHISERHSIYSSCNYFGFGKIGDPSKFNYNLIPIYDYVNIADDVYETGVKDTKSHKNSDLFEKFKGKSNKYSGSKGDFKTFYLILYKNTQIVHSLYPEDDLIEKKPKRILKEFGRCGDKMIVNHKLIEDWITISIPYENKSKIIRYFIIIRLNIYSKYGKIYVQVNDLTGRDFFTTYPALFSLNAKNLDSPIFLQDHKFNMFLNGLAFMDLSLVENKIAEIEENLYKETKQR